MVWFVSGDRTGLVLGVSKSGAPTCYGSGRHEPRPPGLDDLSGNIDLVLLGRIKQSKCLWSVVTSDDDDVGVDAGGEGLLERVRKSPEALHGMIKFYENPDSVAFSIVLPGARYSRVQQLLEHVLKSSTIEHLFSIHFLGFRVLHARTATPTWQEFVGGTPYFFDELSFVVRNPDDA